LVNIYKAFGERLRSIRKAKGLTQEEVAERGGINPKYYGAIERGQINVTLKTMDNLASVLGVKLGELFSFDLLPNEKEKEEVMVNIISLLRHASKDKLRRLNLFLSKVFR